MFYITVKHLRQACSGNHDGPRNACLALLSIAPDFLEFAQPTREFPLPTPGRTRFYFMTYDGPYTAGALEDDLGNNWLPPSPLFHKAHEVIAQVSITNTQPNAPT
ncbi:MAG: hypothetical protein HUU46_05360 [Candidatus Hydrogenedentes bacterium]|nr:hypothetical protein [Candidatus Hydrogenedentota bacterium]